VERSATGISLSAGDTAPGFRFAPSGLRAGHHSIVKPAFWHANRASQTKSNCAAIESSRRYEEILQSADRLVDRFVYRLM
jgi:hypothetical protein